MSLLSEIDWVYPWALLLLPAPLLVYVLVPARKSGVGRALRVPDGCAYLDWSQTLPAAHPLQRLRLCLLVLTWCALLLACVRPQHIGEPLSTVFSGRDLMMCIDISGSMRETDLYAGNQRATRMAVVRQVASDFVSRREGDRIGLIMFGSQAYVQTPLTFDHDTVQHFLAEAAVGLAGRSTAIGDAIGLAVKRLRERNGDSRVIVLLTDGQNSAGALTPMQATLLAADNGIRIHAIGVGADTRGTFGHGAELDEATLRRISETTGGQYFRARSREDLQRIYDTIDELEPSEQDIDQFRQREELFPWPLALALLASIFWSFCGSWQQRAG